MKAKKKALEWPVDTYTHVVGSLAARLRLN